MYMYMQRAQCNEHHAAQWIVRRNFQVSILCTVPAVHLRTYMFTVLETHILWTRKAWKTCGMLVSFPTPVVSLITCIVYHLAFQCTCAYSETTTKEAWGGASCHNHATSDPPCVGMPAVPLHGPLDSDSAISSTEEKMISVHTTHEDRVACTGVHSTHKTTSEGVNMAKVDNNAGSTVH